jgi:hypothetical protein
MAFSGPSFLLSDVMPFLADLIVRSSWDTMRDSCSSRFASLRTIFTCSNATLPRFGEIRKASLRESTPGAAASSRALCFPLLAGAALQVQTRDFRKATTLAKQRGDQHWRWQWGSTFGERSNSGGLSGRSYATGRSNFVLTELGSLMLKSYFELTASLPLARVPRRSCFGVARCLIGFPPELVAHRLYEKQRLGETSSDPRRGWRDSSICPD